MTGAAASSAVHGQGPTAVQPVGGLARLGPPAASVAAAVLALSSTGSMVVAAVLIGIGTRSRWAGIVAVLATASVAVRFSTAEFGDVAGIQSVLGAAGVVGPPSAAASAWLAAAAVVLAVPAPPDSPLPAAPERAGELPGPAVVHLLPAVAAGALAATIVAGPGPGGGLVVRVVATAAAVALGIALRLGAGHPSVVRVCRPVAAVCVVAAVALASWPG